MGEFFMLFALMLSITWFAMTLAHRLVVLLITWLGWDKTDWFHSMAEERYEE